MIMPIIFNNILNKSTIEGIIIGKDVGLPPLLKMPKVTPNPK